MNIPDEQLDAIGIAASASIQDGVIGYRRSYVDAIIAEWEKMRPKEAVALEIRHLVSQLAVARQGNQNLVVRIQNLDAIHAALREDLVISNRQLAEARQANANLAADNAALQEALPERPFRLGYLHPQV